MAIFILRFFLFLLIIIVVCVLYLSMFDSLEFISLHNVFLLLSYSNFYFCSLIVYFWKVSNLFYVFDRFNIITSMFFILFVLPFFIEFIAVHFIYVRGKGDMMLCSSIGCWRLVMDDMIAVIILLLSIAI